MIESIKDLLQKEAQAVLNIPVTDAYEKAVDLIIEQICIKKDRDKNTGKSSGIWNGSWFANGGICR